MIRQTLREEIGRILPHGRILFNEPMDRHCSFRTGGAADALVLVHSEREMAELLAMLREQGEPFFLLGKGTNLLIGDGGFRGVIVTAVRTMEEGRKAAEAAGRILRGAAPASESDVSAGDKAPEEEAGGTDIFELPFPADQPLDRIRVQGNRLIAGAGATMKAAALTAMVHGLTGLEFAAGIPGTVGGGLVMNAGAYGGEMRQVVRRVRLLMPDGSIRTCTTEEMEFGYRSSLLRKIPAVALQAEMELALGTQEMVRALIAELGARRRDKQPLEFPSAGSTFKRPEGYFAGKLIMDAGLRGYRVGGAQVSEKHCGFIINRGGATSAQIRQLIEEVQRKVFEESGVRLEREVIFLGEF